MCCYGYENKQIILAYNWMKNKVTKHLNIKNRNNDYENKAHFTFKPLY